MFDMTLLKRPSSACTARRNDTGRRARRQSAVRKICCAPNSHSAHKACIPRVSTRAWRAEGSTLDLPARNSPSRSASAQMEHGRGTVIAACERSGTGTDKAAHANAAHPCLCALTDYVEKLLGYLIHRFHRMPEVIGAAI
jgi:hypothetical protein